MRNGKKWISGLLAIACTLGMFAFGACKDDESEDDNKVDFEEEVEVVEFKLDYRARTLSLLETFQLEVRGYDNLTWSSSDSTIVSVDQNGLITANGYGTATITVVSGENSDKCVVTVEDVGLVPTIQTNSVGGAVALLRGDSYALDCSILFNGKTYDDATFTFVSSDTQVATVSAEGVITALQQGETTVTITASWRNYETVLLTENLQVTVNPNLSIEFSLADEEIYTVSEVIDGVQYTNETDATWRIVLEDVDVTDTTAVEFIYSEPSVVEVSANGKVTALKKGETEVALQCTVDGKTYVSLGVPITVYAPEQSLTSVESVVYRTADTTGLRVENLQGEFLSLSCAAGDFTDDVRVDGANISVYNTNFADMRGETRFFIETDVYTYLYDVVFVTHVITTYKELDEILETANGENHDSSDWYIVLGNDINANDGTATNDLDMASKFEQTFEGSFNGLGRTVSNLKVTGQGGIFGRLKGAEIVNVAFVGFYKTATRGYVFNNYVHGASSVANVYIEGYSAEARPVFRGGSPLNVNNAVMNVKYEEGTAAYAFETDYAYALAMNCYAIGDFAGFHTTGGENPTVSGTVYADTMSFVEAGRELASVSADDYWTADAYGVYFNGQLIATDAERVVRAAKEATLYEYSETDKAFTKKATIDIDLLGITGGKEVARVFAGGVEVQTFENGTLHLSTALCTAGENALELSVYADGKMFVQPYMVISHEISTIDQFIAYINGAMNNDANLYAVLTADIDYDDKTLSINETGETSQTAQFRGVFDGLGHTVSNWQVGGRGGVFGPFNGTLKNVAFVNIVNTRGSENNASGILFGYTYGGAVENVYVKGSFKYERAACGINSRGNEITWTNCVFDITFADGTAEHSVLQNQKTDYITNVYAIGNGTQLSTKVATAPYATATDFATAAGETLANVSIDDYWTADEYGVYFNGQLIATIGESVVNETKRLTTYAYSQTNGTYTKQDTLSINLLELTNGSAIAKVFVNGVETDAVSGGVLQLNVADLAMGEETLEILVYAGSKMITQRYTIVSHEISTIDQFIAYINGAMNNDASLYAVLTADIDYDDKTLSINETGETSQTAQFRGVFDGLGHTVSNWQVGGRGGVFGPFNGTLKNVAFVNIVNTRGSENNASGILFGYTYGGVVDNVYVKGSFKYERAACGINSRGNEITWTNCVFDVTFKDGTASHSVLQNQKDSMLTNVYAIGNGAQLSTKVATAPYKTATALVSSVGETLANVSADDCWTIQDGDLYFGNTKVE